MSWPLNSLGFAVDVIFRRFVVLMKAAILTKVRHEVEKIPRKSLVSWLATLFTEVSDHNNDLIGNLSPASPRPMFVLADQIVLVCLSMSRSAFSRILESPARFVGFLVERLALFCAL